MSHSELIAPTLLTSLPAFVAQPPVSFDMKEDFFDALSANDIGRAADVFAADGVLLFPGLRPVSGRPLVKRMLSLIRRRYSSISWEMNSTIYADSWLVSAWSVFGKFQQTGSKYENEGVSLIKLDDAGRIIMLSDYFKDTLSFSPAVIDRSTRGVSARV